jgi:DNA polymerase V
MQAKKILPMKGNISDIYPVKRSSNTPLPLLVGKVSAGFPSIMDDHEEEKLDLNKHLVKNPSASFFIRVSGFSMIEAGIHDQDILLVDRQIPPKAGSVVVAVVDGELTVKKLSKKNASWQLQAQNPQYPDINHDDAENIEIWGVVTYVIHKV